MTAQVHENLIYNGRKTSMAFCPPLPENHPRVVPDAGTDGSGMFLTTACWRGYIGTWEIKRGKFYLVSLEGGYKVIGGEPIFAEWFTGVIRVPTGRILQYVHMGFGSVYEKEVHIKIKKGVVVKSRTIDNRGRKFDLEDIYRLGFENLPGFENRFEGDDEL
jgi:hypothetical protein